MLGSEGVTFSSITKDKAIAYGMHGAKKFRTLPPCSNIEHPSPREENPSFNSNGCVPVSLLLGVERL